MQKQPHSSNNPANPLMKVAALNISRAHETRKKYASCKISITLNFKKSSDLRGTTVDKLGKQITVNFTLAVKKATLEMRFEFKNEKDYISLHITEIAFVESLITKQSIDDAREIELTANTEIASKEEVALDLSAKTALANLVIGASRKGNRLAKKKGTRRQKIKSNYKITGISGTYAGNTINWNIDSLWTRKEEIESNEGSTYLLGEVFKDSVTGAKIYACDIKWDYLKASSALEIHASVRAMMQDLIIEDVTFTDEDGNYQKWSVIARSDDGNTPLSEHLGWGRDEIKRRLVRQIIRKHLISQGMLAEGANVEICSAHG